MSLPALAGQVASLVAEGLRISLWGYRCPLYCTETNLSLIALTFLIGFLFGGLTTVWLLGLGTGSLKPRPAPTPRPAPGQLGVRLGSPCMRREDPEVTQLYLGPRSIEPSHNHPPCGPCIPNPKTSAGLGPALASAEHAASAHQHPPVPTRDPCPESLELARRARSSCLES